MHLHKYGVNRYPKIQVIARIIANRGRDVSAYLSDRYNQRIRRPIRTGVALRGFMDRTSCLGSAASVSLPECSLRVRIGIVLTVLIIYAISFSWIYDATSAIVAAFAVVPVSCAGALFGVRGGLFAGLFCVPLNMLLFSHSGVSGSYMLIRYWPGTLAYLVVGVAVGCLRDLSMRLHRNSEELAEERERLVNEITVRKDAEAELLTVRAELEKLLDERSAQLELTGSVLEQEAAGRRQAEEMVHANEQLYRSLVETSPYAITLADSSGLVFMANPEAIKLFGETDPGQVIGRHLTEWVVPEEMDRAIALFPRLMAGEVLRGEPLRVMRGDGKLFWAEISATKVRRNGIADDIILVHANDVTVRREAEDALCSSHDTLRAFGTHLDEVMEAERKAIAREIHDELGQSLTAIKFDIAFLSKRLKGHNRTVSGRLESIEEMVDHTVRTVQRISSELRPRLLDELGLSEAIEWQLQEFSRRTGIQCNMLLDIAGVNLDQRSSTALYRILQEALTNVLRHASASEVDVTLVRKGWDVMLTTADNGRGISAGEIDSRDAFGLIGMRERATMCGGNLSITGEAGKGTIVEVSLPVPGEGLSC